MSDDPVRLDLADDAPLLAREALRLARADAPPAGRLAAIEAGVIAKIGPPGGGGGGGGGGGAGAGTGTGTLVKAAGVAIVGGAAVTAIVMATRPAPPPTSAPVEAAAPPATVVIAPSASASEAPAIAVSDLPSAPSASSAKTAAVATATTDPAESERAEVALLDAAQRSLASNPAETLRRCDEHARTFANGTLVQEREVLAIDALLRLGRRADAEARAARFRRAYPRSGHLRRIDALLGD